VGVRLVASPIFFSSLDEPIEWCLIRRDSSEVLRSSRNWGRYPTRRGICAGSANNGESRFVLNVVFLRPIRHLLVRRTSRNTQGLARGLLLLVGILTICSGLSTLPRVSDSSFGLHTL
jgi:hypothetical protein